MSVQNGTEMVPFPYGCGPEGCPDEMLYETAMVWLGHLCQCLAIQVIYSVYIFNVS